MRFEEQVRLKLAEIVERDGYADVAQFTDWCVNNLLANAPRQVVEEVLKAAIQHFVREALDEHEGDDSLILADVFIRGEGGVMHEYVIKRGDENGVKLAQAHHANGAAH
jgi:hypothetical protein